MDAVAPIPNATESPTGPTSPAWRLALWGPPALLGVLVVAVEIASRAGLAFPFGVAFLRGESARDFANAWLCLLTMTGVSAVLSGYGCLMLAASNGPAGAAVHRPLAGLVGSALVIALLAWSATAGDRFGDGESVLGWTIGAHLPTLTLCYGLLGSGVAHVPNRRAGMVMLLAFPVFSLSAQLLYLPGEDTRAAALGFILNSGLIALAVAARLAIWLRYEDTVSAPKHP